MNTDSAVGGLIKMGGNLDEPRNASGKDWPNVGASGPAGEASGAGKLVTQTEAQEGPRHTEDGGENTPSVWGQVSGFAVAKNKGEGGMASTAVSIKGSVDLNSGSMVPNAEDQTY
jgi:hypothetical protein